MKKLLGFAVFCFAGSLAGSASAAEALLLRHDVVEINVGETAQLHAGFFIGKAVATDTSIAHAGMDQNYRTVNLVGLNPGRTVITAWNIREPNKRIELEVVVKGSELATNTATTATTAPATATTASEPVVESTQQAVTPEPPAATDESTDSKAEQHCRLN